MRDEQAHLWDMLKSAKSILAYVDAMTWEHFETNAAIQDAINWRLVIIGESAKAISAETRARLPQLPFSDMARMRDKMIHVYWRVDARIIWQTIKQDLPALVQVLAQILPSEAQQ